MRVAYSRLASMLSGAGKEVTSARYELPYPVSGSVKATAGSGTSRGLAKEGVKKRNPTVYFR